MGTNNEQLNTNPAEETLRKIHYYSYMPKHIKTVELDRSLNNLYGAYPQNILEKHLPPIDPYLEQEIFRSTVPVHP